MKVAFYKGTRPGMGGLFNRIVRLWLRGPYSHVELVFPNGLSASSSFLDGGVRFKLIEFKPDHWDFVEIECDELAALRWFQAHEGDAYDLFGIVGFIVRPFKGHKRRWVCSEAIMAALGFEEPWRFDPCSMAAVLRGLSQVGASVR